MVKRQKWLSEEDKILKSLIKKYKKKVNWEKISEELENHNIMKNSKQCRERWIHQLDPSLIKKKWTLEENQKLFQLHNKTGNRWKIIAKEFEGRTDNTIKNQFFSIIRRSLRIARKILGKNSNTTLINQIKPSSLSEFIKKSITVTLPDRLVTDGNKVVIIRINSFIQKFGFKSYKDITCEITDKDKYVIKELIDLLLGVNKNYIRKKNIKKKKKIKKLNNIPKLMKSINEMLNNSKKKVDETDSLKNKQTKLQNSIKKSMNNSKIKKNKLFFKNLNKSSFSNDFETLLTQKQKIERKLTENCITKAPKISKKDLIKNFTNLGENIYRIRDLVLNSSQIECEEYFSAAKKEMGFSFIFPNEKSEDSQQNRDFFAELQKSSSEKSEKLKNNINSINYNRFNSFNSRALKSEKLLEDTTDQKDFNINDFNITHNGINNRKKKLLKRRTTNLKMGGFEKGFKPIFKNKNTVDLSIHKQSIEEFNENFLRQNSVRSNNNFNSILSYKSKKNYDIQDIKYKF